MQFVSESSRENALKLNNKTFGDKIIKVTPSRFSLVGNINADNNIETSEVKKEVKP